jgi:hypothetical protein
MQRKKQEKFNKHMNSYLKGGTNMEYSPFYLNNQSTLSNNRYTIRLTENSVWYSGIDYDLQLFYQQNTSKMRNKGDISDAINYFWRNTKQTMRKIHSGVPQLICEKMVDLITGNGYKINLMDALEDDDDNLRLQEILKDNKFNMLLQHGIETESWSGGAPFRITTNKAISEYPIIEVVEPEHYSYREVSGRIIEDVYTTYPTEGNDKYRLKAIYGVREENGIPESYIDYKLERVSEDKGGKTWTEVSLESLPSTSQYTPFSVKGYNKKFSLYKPNKLPNSEFRGSMYGESDYSGSIGAFDAVDEIVSTWIQEFRDGKLNRYIPSNLLPKNSRDETVINRILDKDFITYDGSISEEAKEKIEYKQGEVRTDKHIESYKHWMMIVLNNAGLSPLTVGMTGLEAMNAGEASQQEREKVSIRTRNKKIEGWEEHLNDFLERVLVFDDVVNNLNEDGSTSFGEYEVNTTFEDYILKTKKDRTAEVAEGSGTGWDILSGVKYIHDDMTDLEQLAISARIKLENNIESLSVAEASALQAYNKQDIETLEDEGVEIIVEEEDGQENDDGVVIEDEDITPPAEEIIEE